MNYKEINLEQGTEEWLDFRRHHITATDTAVICGKNPFKTPFQLYKQKTECFEDKVNAAMERGSRLEEEAREFLREKNEIDLNPKVFESVEHPFMMASLDAVSDDREIGYEIKCPGMKVMQEALDGKVSPMYIYQCQKQMLVMGWDEMFLFFYTDTNINCTIKVKRDEKIIEEIIEKESEFWNNLVNLEPPALSANDYYENLDEEANIMASRLLNAMQTKKEAEKEIEACKAYLKENSGNQATKYVNARLRYTPYFVEGRVDYKKMIEDLDVEYEKIKEYKKPKTLQHKFSMY